VTYDVAVVGGGIIGLATARELTRRYPHLKIAGLEKEPDFNRHQSGRNSGVIHSGIYYKPGSLKARLCIEGRKLAWQYCDAKGIEYKRVGKLIVAIDDAELVRLDELWERGHANGVEGLQMLDASGMREREPHCRGIRAIFSPVTCIVDWARVSRSFADDAKEAGAEFFLDAKVEAITRSGGAIRLRTPRKDVHAKHVITCGGLFSDRLAKMTGCGIDPKIVPFRGDYLILKPEKTYLVRGNIYPVPDPELPFLGVHFTPRMDGSVWLGPSAVPAFAREGYTLSTIDPLDVLEMAAYPGFLKLATRFWHVGLGEIYRDVVRPAYVEALRRYVPELRVDDCLRGPSGVRAQAMTMDGQIVDDFAFDAADGVLHVRNAPSPGATASLAIAQHIVAEAAKRFDLEGAVSS
jgi:L-2-hydroxyglutarate oxidase LhgO